MITAVTLLSEGTIVNLYILRLILKILLYRNVQSFLHSSQRNNLQVSTEQLEGIFEISLSRGIVMVLYSAWGWNRGTIAEGMMETEEYGEVMWVLEMAHTHEGVKDVWHQSLENKK